MSEEYLRLDVWDAHDRRFEAEMRAQKEAVALALASSQRALDRAEKAQDNYNILHNGLQRQMGDERRELVSRAEYSVLLDRIGQLESGAAGWSGKVAGVLAAISVLMSVAAFLLSVR